MLSHHRHCGRHTLCQKRSRQRHPSGRPVRKKAAPDHRLIHVLWFTVRPCQRRPLDRNTRCCGCFVGLHNLTYDPPQRQRIFKSFLTSFDLTIAVPSGAAMAHVIHYRTRGQPDPPALTGKTQIKRVTYATNLRVLFTQGHPLCGTGSGILGPIVALPVSCSSGPKGTDGMTICTESL